MNPELVLWKDKQNWQAFKQTHQEKQKEDPNKNNQKWKRRITTDTIEIQRIVRNYYEELYAKKRENLDEMDTFLEKYNLPKLSKEEAESLNRPITLDKMERAIKMHPTHKNLGPDGFTGEFYRAFKGELTPILHRLFQKIQEDRRLPKSF